jgi:putative glutamine amidotransferase
MRLVSVLYEDFHPFNKLDKFKSYYCIDNADELDSNDVVIVHGGADISPALYNKQLSFMSDAEAEPSRRDEIEWSIMQRAKQLGCPIIGLCRGGQMLTALAGGYLIQHIENHFGTHPVVTRDNKIIQVNSIHHQMMVPYGTDHELIAWSKHKLSNVYFDEDKNVAHSIEPEFIYYPSLKGFAIQWHPEMMAASTPANQYLLSFINERI